MDRKLQRHRADSLRQHGFLVTIVMPPGPVSCIGGTKYPHCIVLYCIVLIGVVILQLMILFPNITPILRQLHRLKAAEWIQFKLPICCSGTTLMYLVDELFQPADLGIRSCMSSASGHQSIVHGCQPLAIKLSDCHCSYVEHCRFLWPLSATRRYWANEYRELELNSVMHW